VKEMSSKAALTVTSGTSSPNDEVTLNGGAQIGNNFAAG